MNELNPLEGKRAVIVEDEGMAVIHLRKAMGMIGMEIVGEAPNGQVGLDIILKERPDLVVLDINMPVMDGITTAHRILEVYRPCLVFLTAYKHATYREDLDQIEPDGYINKPAMIDVIGPTLQLAYASYQQLQAEL